MSFNIVTDHHYSSFNLYDMAVESMETEKESLGNKTCDAEISLEEIEVANSERARSVERMINELCDFSE